MYTYVPTLTDYILQEEKRVKHATGHFTKLIAQIENASKIIASHVKASGLADILGKTGKTNATGDEIQKLDQFSNDMLMNTLLQSGCVYGIVSEELEEAVLAPKEHAGDYIVFFDPLDGSSNIDTNCPIGTIFSIYHKDGGLLQKGRNQIAAGYIIYGSSVMFVVTFGNGVNGFTLDPAIGSFLLSHPNMTVPQAGKIYSINEAYEKQYSLSILSYLGYLKSEGESRARYVGSLVADAHRTFIKGGIFLYPADKKQPEGKLRLTIEVNPFAFLTEQAKGIAVLQDGSSPLEILPTQIHQRSPLIFGSVENVEKYLSFTK